MLTRDMILKAQDYSKEEVDVPEWGGSIFLRQMTVTASDEMQQIFLRLGGGGEINANQNGSIRDAQALKGLRVAMVSRCLCDDKGRLLFDDDEGRELLAQKSSVVIERLYDIAMRINKMAEEVVEEEKKDLPETVSAVSSSRSA